MFAQLMARRVPHFLGLYLGSGWVLLEFSDWVVERYLLSPYWAATHCHLVPAAELRAMLASKT